MAGMTNREKIRTLLKGIETGDPASVLVVNEARYIQHNPQTEEGSEGLAALFKRLSATSPRVEVVRAFEDGDFVFAHTLYDFSRVNVGFEVFRFEDGRAVEHWDNIQPKRGPNASGRDMLDGQVEIEDVEKTEQNRQRVAGFVSSVLVGNDLSLLPDYVSHDIIEHNPALADGIDALHSHFSAQPGINYETTHRVLAEGNFVLTQSEGHRGGIRTAFYDLFRLVGGVIVEHWDTTEAIAPVDQWKNDNGKF